MKNKSIQFSSIIDGVTKKKDGTLSIKLGTQELSPEDTAQIFEMGNKQIWTAFSEVALRVEDINIPEITDELDKKSPSERLRNTIYILWDQNKNKSNKTFNEFYRDYMEKIISNIKEKLV